MGSRLKNAVTVETGKVGEEVYMDRISATDAQKVTTRHGDSPQIDTPHDRRRVVPVDYDWGDLIDNPDRLRTLIDPASAYSVNAAMAMDVQWMTRSLPPQPEMPLQVKQVELLPHYLLGKPLLLIPTVLMLTATHRLIISLLL